MKTIKTKSFEELGIIEDLICIVLSFLPEKHLKLLDLSYFELVKKCQKILLIY